MHGIMWGWYKQGNPHKGNCNPAILNYLVTKSYRTYVYVRTCTLSIVYFVALLIVTFIVCILSSFLSTPSPMIWPVHLISTQPYPTLMLTHKILYTHHSPHFLNFSCSSHHHCTLSFNSLLHHLSYTTLYYNILLLLMPLFSPALPFLVTVYLKPTHTPTLLLPSKLY